MSLPTEEEKIAIEQFRARVGDAVTEEQLADDWFLIRWLRDRGLIGLPAFQIVDSTRELNLLKAEAMLRNSIKWREENDVNSTLQRQIDPYFTTNYPFDANGKDRLGRALVVVPIGKWDIKAAVESGRTDQLISYFNYYFEKVMEKIGESDSGDPNCPHTQISAIFDWDGYTFRQFAKFRVLQTFLKLASVYEAHYPEILHQLIIINATPLFQMVFTLAKKLVPEKTVKKVKIFGTDRKEWEIEVFKIVDPDQYKYQLKMNTK